ncbi:alpha/beta hydrolase [Nocardioides sp. Kera G14]|uniref:alpha/beta hydrolase n=1 Tax=Nocardioides sp. Kera G14 TaxID=2884264 RepID=UPI001D106215|nr:alpha/beta hydrolase [Nocardioides sp. Kera G14]UDY25357.1 alpha/beta hydrolase [Nocardioides sp. Kera G14]
MACRGDILATLDPELRSIARFLPLGLGLQRGLRLPRAASRVVAVIGAVRGVETAEVIPGVTVRVHRPTASGPAPTVLWLHGGGTIVGSAAQDDKWCRRIAAELGVVVVAVDYRLAPEHPYPVPVEDCYAALQWVARQSWVDATRLAVAGASAGGLLTASVARLARDRGGPRLAAMALAYPMLDDRTGSVRSGRRWLMWSEQDNVIAWRWYVGSGDTNPASPARWTDLAGLPPAWVGVGTSDMLHDEAVAFAPSLVGAGVPTTLEVADGGYHGFDQISPGAAVSQRFITSLFDHLRTHLAP